MMKLLRITGTVLLGLLLSAPGCEGPGTETGNQDEAAFITSRDSIRNEFTADNLTDADLHAFEENAMQKLYDFADYSNISADNLLDSAFRLQAQQMIDGLFLQRNEFYKKHPMGKIVIDSIYIIDPLHITNGSQYRGLLGASQCAQTIRGNDTVSAGSVSIRVEIVAVKTAKVFGRDTLNVWEVFLGDILPGL